jgi:hypothetical protein
MKSVKLTDALGRRPKRIFSQETKQKLCSEWRNSGLNKSRFCKEKGLCLSAFSLWCQKIFNSKDKFTSKKDWVPLVSKDTCPKHEHLISFEVKLPNGMVFNTSFESNQFLDLLKNFSNALTAVR